MWQMYNSRSRFANTYCVILRNGAQWGQSPLCRDCPQRVALFFFALLFLHALTDRLQCRLVAVIQNVGLTNDVRFKHRSHEFIAL